MNGSTTTFTRSGAGRRRGFALMAATTVAAVSLTTLGAHATTPSALHAIATTPTRAGDYIVRATDVDAAVSAVSAAGGTVTKRLSLIGGVAAHLAPGAFRELARTTTFTITPDSVLRTSGDSSSSNTTDMGSLVNLERSIGATEVWSDGGTGRGVGVALVDTGIVPVPGLDTAGKIINGPDLSYEADNPALANLDTAGHGTHLASIIAGRDATADPKKPSSGFMGVAPNATLVNVKVATADGTTSVSTVIDGLGWVVDNQSTLGVPIRVLNLAFASDPSTPYVNDPLAYAVEQVWNAGIVVVAAAGNAGPTTSTLADPAYDPFVIAAGASDPHGTVSLSDDTAASFSQAGSATRGVDIVAPGVSVEGLRNPGSFIDWLYPEGVFNGRYFKGSGTSQSSAVVSGAVALLIQRFPSITPDGVKWALGRGAVPVVGGTAATTGRGSLQIKRAAEYGETAAKYPSRFAQAWEPAVLGPLAQAPIGTSDPYAGSPFEARRWSSIGWSGDITNADVWAARRWSGDTWDARRWTDASWTAGAWSSAAWGDVPQGTTLP